VFLQQIGRELAVNRKVDGTASTKRKRGGRRAFLNGRPRKADIGLPVKRKPTKTRMNNACKGKVGGKVL